MNVNCMMNRKIDISSGRRLTVLVTLLALLLHVPVDAQVQTQVQTQVPVEISKQKIVVGGKAYYMHQVMKGQTLYSISKAYNVTVDQITRENQMTDGSIKEGQMLSIPVSAAQAAGGKTTGGQPEKPKEQPAARPTVKPEQPVASQPVTPEQRAQMPSTPATQDERFIYHRVRRGETLSSVASEYGLSVRDLKKQNKGLLFPHEGDYLMIPRKKITGQQHLNRQATVTDIIIPADTIAADTTALYDEPETFTRPVEKSVVTTLHGSVKVAVMLPFFLKENSAITYIDSTRKDAQSNTIYREATKPEGLIYEGSLPFLEAYEGILIAVDSLRTLGLSVELDVYDTGADPAQLNRLLSSGMLSDVNLIIGPVFSNNVEHISAWAAERNIPFVSPVSLRDDSITMNKPTMYRVFPSENVIQDVMVNELRAHRGSNVVFLYADSAMYDPATSRLWGKVQSVLGEEASDDRVKALPYYFTGLSSRRNAYSGMTSFENVLVQGKENVIVLASTNTPVVSSALATLHSFARKFDIKVIGYPEIRGLETVDLRYYYDLELIIPVESYVDFDSPATHSFSVLFMKKFKTEPMAESFAWRGFDIAWYFIGGIATGREAFLADPGVFNPPLLCLDPVFSRDNRMNGYENSGMLILHYMKNMTIEIKRPLPVVSPAEDNYLRPVTYPASDSLRHNRVR